MRTLPMAALGLVLAALPGCAGTPTPPGERVPVQIESTELLQLESYPVQLMLHVEGWLPNPCSTPDWEIEDSGPGEIRVELYAVPDGSKACIQVLAPFEVNILLGPQAGGSARILLNGEAVVAQAAQ